MWKTKKTKAILIVLILVGASTSTILLIEGSKREDPGTVVWESKNWGDFSLDGNGDIFVSDGVLYGSAVHYERGYGVSGQVIAVDLEEDELLWNHSYHGSGRHSIPIYSIFEFNGIVYSGDQHGNVTAVDAETGKKIWRNSFHEGRYIGSVNSLHVSNGMIFSASDNETVVGADTESGEKCWRHKYHNGSVFSVHAEDGKVYSTSGDGKVTAVDAETGARLWDHNLHNESVVSLYVHDGIVYSGSLDNELIAYDTEEEDILWSHSHHDGSVSTIDVKNGIVYSGGADGYVIAADTSDGKKIWQHRRHREKLRISNWGIGDAIHSIQVEDGKVYSQCNNGDVLAVENEGSLTIGVSRTLASFWSWIQKNLIWMVLSIAIIIVAVGILIVKSGGWTRIMSDRDFLE